MIKKGPIKHCALLSTVQAFSVEYRIFPPLTIAVVLFLLSLSAFANDVPGNASDQSDVKDGLKVSDNHRYLVDAKTGKPVFILADTAWNLGALKIEEIDAYLQSRADHGFNTVMFALNFAPQADENNAYGQPAYIGPEHDELNPAYFETCDRIIRDAAARGIYVMIFTLWAREGSGTMNRYTPPQLSAIGHALGKRYAGIPNVIFCVGGEATPPHHIDTNRVNALGFGLKEGCQGKNLVTVHPESEYSSAKSSWLDFSMIQAKSSADPSSVTYDAAALVLRDWQITPPMPTMMGEHRYESGTDEDPLIQRRSLYQCVFAGACGHAYGHNAIWQMSPHTAQGWMLRGWPPGVKNWTVALDTPAVHQLHYIKLLLYSRPYLQRIPDQSLVLGGQGFDVATRVEATRDGTYGNKDATYLMAYLSAPRKVTLDTAVIPSRTLNAYWFSPETGLSEVIAEHLYNSGTLTLDARPQGKDWVVVVEDAAKNYVRPGKKER
jgi:hypothetical protein